MQTFHTVSLIACLLVFYDTGSDYAGLWLAEATGLTLSIITLLEIQECRAACGSE